MTSAKKWFGKVFCFAGLLFFISGCGKSDFNRMVESTKSQCKASEVKEAALPLFSSYSYYTNNPLPARITSLPIFADDTNDIQMLSLQSTNVFMFITGGGFGHWGIIVSRFNDDRGISQWHRDRMMPWEDGVFFFRD
jgi:hypothetical protein